MVVSLLLAQQQVLTITSEGVDSLRQAGDDVRSWGATDHTEDHRTTNSCDQGRVTTPAHRDDLENLCRGGLRRHATVVFTLCRGGRVQGSIAHRGGPANRNHLSPTPRGHDHVNRASQCQNISLFNRSRFCPVHHTMLGTGSHADQPISVTLPPAISSKSLRDHTPHTLRLAQTQSPCDICIRQVFDACVAARRCGEDTQCRFDCAVAPHPQCNSVCN